MEVILRTLVQNSGGNAIRVLMELRVSTSISVPIGQPGSGLLCLALLL